MCSIIFKLFSITFFLEKLFLYFLLLLNLSQSICKILNLLGELRGLGKKVFIYPDNIKLSKQFSFANKNNFKDVLIYGESENQHNSIKIRNMVSGNEKDFDLKDFINNYD